MLLVVLGAQAQETWSPATSPTTNALWSVGYGGGHFVAVGENGTIVSSPDGLSWTSRVVGVPTAWLVAAAYGAGTWVVVGDNGLILTSTDLSAWNLRASGTTARINGVAYGAGRWMAVAESGELLTSTNASLWTALRPSNDRLHGVVHAYGQFVISGDNGLVRTTIDATDYDEKVLPGSLFVEAVTYARRSFVAVGEAGFAVSSTDAVSWTTLTTGTDSHFRGVAEFNNQFIAAGTAGTIATTPSPGSPWVRRSSGTTALLTSVAASESMAVVVGFGGTILRSAPAAAAPTISAGPGSLIESAGSNVLFQVSAGGSLPLSFQWLFNGQPIAGATSDRLLLTSVQATHAGSYSVRVSNPLGSVTSSAAALQLVASTVPGPIVDSSFAPAILMPTGVASAVEQADGKVIIGGSQFFATGGVSPFALARLNRDGSMDTTFAVGSGLNSGGSVTQLVLQPDGRVLVAGTFQSINGVGRTNLARLNPDGRVDESFSAAAVATLQPSSRITLQPDGKLLVLGGGSLGRLNSDGTTDVSFNRSTATDFGLFSNKTIAVLGGGNPALRRLSDTGGELAMPIQYTVPGYTRSTFGDPSEFRHPDTLISSGDGRIFGSSRYAVTVGTRGSIFAIVSLDGGSSPFLTLLRSTIYESLTYVVSPAQEESVLIGSTITRPQSSTNLLSVTGSVVRHKSSGARDTSFDTRVGTNGAITALFPLRDGGVLVTGTFTTFDGVARPNLVRLVAANAVEAQPPVIVSVSPEAAAVLPGAPLNLVMSAAGSGPLTYRWSASAPGGQSVITDAQAASPNLSFPTQYSGTYTVTVTVANRVGTATSFPIRVVVAPSAPILVVQPATTTALSGRSAALFVTAVGSSPFTYQWFLGGEVVGIGSTLTIPRTSSANGGDYTVVVTNSLGRTTSLPARLIVDTSARLANISTRAAISVERPLIAGFVVGGTVGQRVLVRGIGPGLSQFGITGVLPDPTITVVDGGGRVVGANNNFDPVATPGGLVDGVGAFRLAASLDAALLVTLPPGSYTVQLTDTAARGGIGLLEVYRADDALSRLINLSSRGFAGAGASLAIAGLAVEGERPRQFLIRGIGPALQSFGVTDALADPILNLTSASGESFFRNDDWGTFANGAELIATSARLGAFPLTPGSKDAALLVTLAPGNYTAFVSGVGDTTGTALIEVYEVP